MGFYKPCHCPPQPTTTQNIHITTHHHQKYTHYQLPPPKRYTPSPIITQKIPSTTHHHQNKSTTTHHYPPPTITPPKYTNQHPDRPSITNTTQIKAPEYAKTTPIINLYYLSSCITIWNINWMLNTDNGIKQFLSSFPFNDIKCILKKTTEKLKVNQ